MDVEILNRTLRTVAEMGDGIAIQRRGPHGQDWFAGRVRLNNEAVFQLVRDGWLNLRDRRATVVGYTKGEPAPRIRERD